MRIVVKVGDLLDEKADVIVTTANPWLNMSGGVNGAILLRGGEAIQAELREILRRNQRPHVSPGSVHVTAAGPLAAKHVLHAVAIDAFYETDVELVASTIEALFQKAIDLGAKSVAMPALATGYGPLSINQFAEALESACRSRAWRLDNLTIVLRRPEDAEVVTERLKSLTQS